MIFVCFVCFVASSPSSGADEIDASELALVKAAEAARVRVIERVYPTVVAIYGEQVSKGGGSGVLFDEAGFVLTNYHVVAGAGGAKGWAGLADRKLYRWRLIGIDPGGDLAVIQLQGKDAWPHAPLGDSDDVKVGDFAMAMGNPFALAEDQTPTVTLGIVSGVERYQGGAGDGNFLVYGDCIQIDSSINPGNSGGPLFNLAGEVIGINGRGSFEERGRVNVGLGYAISINQAKNFLPDLLATKIAQHGTLDVVFGTRGGQVVCTAMDTKYSALKDHDFELGDRLVRFDGEPVDSANEYLNILSTLPAGWPVDVAWERDGEIHQADVRLNALPYKQPPKPRRRGQPDQPRRPNLPTGPKLDLASQGRIQFEQVNAQVAQVLLARWNPPRGADQASDLNARLVDAAAYLKLKRAAEAAGAAGEAPFKKITLLGGDRVNGWRAYQFELVFQDDAVAHAWLSVLDLFGQFDQRLLAAEWIKKP